VTDRIQCLVPFCCRHRAVDAPEWICGDHWALVPKPFRRVHFRISRQYRKRCGNNQPWAYPAGSESRIESWRLIHRHRRIWKRIKAIAIQRAGGAA